MIEQLASQQTRLEQVASRMTQAVQAGNQVLCCGNGGSASDARHLAAELVGRFRNAFGFHEVFARQVEALCDPGDVFVGISTSGNSRNVSIALLRAREMGAFTVAVTGQHRGRVGSAADVWIRMPSRDTARIQEAYMLCGHMLSDWIELAPALKT